jgi:uncharacterized membrane protein
MTKLLRIAFRAETRVPMLALVFGSAISIGLIIARALWFRKFGYGFLIWNLFLAWMPLIFALLADDEFRHGPRRRWMLFALAGAWLLFFPNAPYICTDLIHLKFWFHHHFWTGLCLILLFAFTGLMLGFVSLYLMQSLVTEMYGRIAGWLFVLMTVGLSSFGVYLGRFLRFNSWDVVVRPGQIYRGLDSWHAGAGAHVNSSTFLILFAAFLFAAYVMLYALTHLSPAARNSAALPDRTAART